MRTATATDSHAVLALLEDYELPTAGVKEHLEHFLLEFDNDRLIGCAGLEIHDHAGLLRSVAVDEYYRSVGLGTKLIQAVLERAKAINLSSVSLLTETTADYYLHFGFEITPRESLPESLKASAEFRGACPDSAIAMTIRFEP
jgi:amino-acid N-acetyltransferase